MKPYQRFQCSGCGYVYDEQHGEPHEGFVAGTRWREIPEDWACPDCAVREKPDFIPVEPANGSGVEVDRRLIQSEAASGRIEWLDRRVAERRSRKLMYQRLDRRQYDRRLAPSS